MLRNYDSRNSSRKYLDRKKDNIYFGIQYTKLFRYKIDDHNKA